VSTPEARAREEAARAFAQGAAAAAAGQTAGGAAGAATALAATVARASGRIVAQFLQWLAAFGLLTSDALRQLLSQRTRDERFIRELLDAEAERQREFDRKTAERLTVRLPKALAIPDPDRRARRVDALMRQERRYAVARLEAASVRVTKALEHRDLKRLSPQGAWWELGQAEEHTAGCLFMSGAGRGRFWPWEVLDRVHPPRHLGCTSRLVGLGTAIATGRMTMADIPDTVAAIRMAAGVVMEAEVADALLGELEIREGGSGLTEDQITEAQIEAIGRHAVVEGNFEQWARDEIKRAGLLSKDSDYGGMLGRSVLKLVKTFAGEGHSGFSAAMAIEVFEKLARWEPLTALTSDPAEWTDLGEMGPLKTHPNAKRVWQSKRDPRAFSADGGKTWKLLEEAVEAAQRVVEMLADARSE
jgi:hypothetical protein